MAGKFTFFSGNQAEPLTPLRLGRSLWTWERPAVMAILNLSPDSFYEPSALRAPSPSECVDRAGALLEQGADWLDLGGMSTRPGASLIGAEQDCERVLPALEAVAAAFPRAVLSVDTVYAQTARHALDAGAHLINDVSAGTLDPELWNAVARAGVPYVLMHHKGIPAGGQHPDSPHIGLEVCDALEESLLACRNAGIADVILDPGFGFGKSLRDQYRLLADLEHLTRLGAPVLVGVSRKSMITRGLGISAEQALNGTTVLNTLALLGGAAVLRVHDPGAAREAIALLERVIEAQDDPSLAAEEQPAFRP
jgi:dihydropteroate synthase